MRREIELLAPGGDVDSIKAAIVAGADAVYCGLNKFNARNRATNITFENLQGILKLAHANSCQIFVTLNIIIVDSEIRDLFSLLNKLVNTSIDGVIVQDLGMFHLLSTHFKSLKIHASTQLTTHNEGQIFFLNELNATRVNLSRELNIREIQYLNSVAHQKNILTEVFVHGSNCISFSGICYMSSVHGGKSGNRGRCSQPCRDRYLTTVAGKNYPLNLKDNSAYFDLEELYNAGVDSLKIEGRIKEFEYVYTVVNVWKKQIRHFYNHNSLINDNRDLYKVFNRDFSNSFLKGDISKEMFIDNPMSHSIKHHSEIDNSSANEKQSNGLFEFYEEKAETISYIKNKIDQLNIEKTPIKITVSGERDTPLKIEVITPDSSFFVLSEINLMDVGTQPLNEEIVLKRLKSINETEYYIKQLELNLKGELFLSYKELTSIKKRVLFILNGSKEMIVPVDIPVLKKQSKIQIKPTLSILISSENDLALFSETTADIYFQLPDSFKSEFTALLELFKNNKKLIPWFPSVLIGDDYKAAVDFMLQLNPKKLVSNNTGIAYEAYKNEIPWIAGPFLNSVNSFSLICFKEKFNCTGAFISNEISKTQIQRIIKPDHFKLYYSIYHPIVLMTSRQCLFHQVTACGKFKIDDSCIQHCEKSASITNLKEDTFFIKKTKGNYHQIYNETNLLNTDIITDVPNLFSSFFIDLRDIKTETNIEIDKSNIIRLFENHLNGIPDSKKELTQNIQNTNNTQYKNGI